MGRWVTCKGRHIFIEDGESLESAMERHGIGEDSSSKSSKKKEDTFLNRAKEKRKNENSIPDPPKREDYEKFIDYKHARDEYRKKYGDQLNKDKNENKSFEKNNDKKRKQLPTMDKEQAIEQLSKDMNISREQAAKVKDSLDLYTSNQFEKIRDKNNTNEKYVEARNNIEYMISKSPSYEGKIYRGMQLKESDADAFLSNLKVDSSIDMKGISSWSSDYKVAKNFAFKGDKPVSIIFTLDNKTGVGINHLSLVAKESEVLQSGNTKFFVNSIKISKEKSVFNPDEFIDVYEVEVKEG